MAFKAHCFVFIKQRGAEFQTQIARLEGELLNHCAAVTALKEFEIGIRSLALMSVICCRQMIVIKI